jgi:AcrR family transcriptional regulator
MAGAETRERILDVSRELFTEQGYDGTSLREIADELGFTKAALYYHFQSKEEILRALLEPVEAVIDELHGRLEAATDLEGWGGALEWVISQLSERLDFFQLVQRNHQAVESILMDGPLGKGHEEMHARVEAAATSVSPKLRDQVRMIAALGAVTGFDDWAPDLLAMAPRPALQAELTAAVRDTLGLPRRRTARPVPEAGGGPLSRAGAEQPV